MLVDDTGQDQGGSGSQNLDNSDLGNQGGEGNQNQGTPSGQDGQQTDQGDAEKAKLRADNKALNRALIEARRGQRQQPQNQGDGQSAFETPEGQYAISLEVATGQLLRSMEDVYDLYPEVPASEIARIRRNPWAFASHQSFITGDVETAKLEIEQALLDRAEELGQGANGNAGQQPANQGGQTPASISSNQPQEQGVEAEPGTDEDENPWTMPLGKLERKAKKEAQAAQATP